MRNIVHQPGVDAWEVEHLFGEAMRNFGPIAAWAPVAGLAAMAQALPALQILAFIVVTFWCATILLLILVGVFGPKKQAKNARNLARMVLGRPAPPPKTPSAG